MVNGQDTLGGVGATVISPREINAASSQTLRNLYLAGSQPVNIWGNNAGNVLGGNAGNNTLRGGSASDTYLYSAGGGQDRIEDAGGQDTLKFTDVDFNQLWLARKGNDLEIQLLGKTDKVTVVGHYLGAQSTLERIEAADGKSLNISSINTLVAAMASMTPPASAASTLTAQQHSAFLGLAGGWINS